MMGSYIAVVDFCSDWIVSPCPMCPVGAWLIGVIMCYCKAINIYLSIYIYVYTQNCIPLDVSSKNLGRHTVYGYYIALYHWLVVWNMAFISPSIQLGMSSSQLTNSLHHFSEG